MSDPPKPNHVAGTSKGEELVRKRASRAAAASTATACPRLHVDRAPMPMDRSIPACRTCRPRSVPEPAKAL